MSTPGTRRVGLTGGIATGKTHVRARLAAYGVPTIDADLLAREAVAPGSEGLRQVAAHFGPEVLTQTGELDRGALGARVFTDSSARHALEAIIHPWVQRAIDAWFDALPPSCPYAVADVPLLFEAGFEGGYDRVIVTACAPHTQLSRLMSRDGLSDTDARRRIAAQWPLAEKVRRADFVILTDGSLEDTEAQVLAVCQALDALWPAGASTGGTRD